jgi:hypothetical protein
MKQRVSPAWQQPKAAARAQHLHPQKRKLRPQLQATPHGEPQAPRPSPAVGSSPPWPRPQQLRAPWPAEPRLQRITQQRARQRAWSQAAWQLMAKLACHHRRRTPHRQQPGALRGARRAHRPSPPAARLAARPAQRPMWARSGQRANQSVPSAARQRQQAPGQSSPVQLQGVLYRPASMPQAPARRRGRKRQQVLPPPWPSVPVRERQLQRAPVMQPAVRQKMQPAQRQAGKETRQRPRQSERRPEQQRAQAWMPWRRQPSAMPLRAQRPV